MIEDDELIAIFHKLFNEQDVEALSINDWTDDKKLYLTLKIEDIICQSRDLIEAHIQRSTKLDFYLTHHNGDNRIGH